MNHKSTILLACLVAGAGLLALLSSRGGRSADGGASGGAGGLGFGPDSVIEVRVQRDYWNTFTLSRGETGAWRLVEPSSEEASVRAAGELVNALGRFPVVTTVDLPADDSERFREYGLWEPAVEITVTTEEGTKVLQVGGETADGKGVYCAIQGRDGVLVTTQQTAQTLLRDLEAYRAGASTTTTSTTTTSQSAHVRIEDTRVGDGPPVRAGQRLGVHYTGRLEDGTEFDSSHKRGVPFTLTLGAGEVIGGWEQGLAGMRVGGRRQLTIPPDLGYGPAGKPPAIPPNATLVFDIELLSADDGAASGVTVSTEVLEIPDRQLGSSLRVGVRLDGNAQRRVGTYAFDLTYPHDVLSFEEIADGGDGFLETPAADESNDGSIAFSGISPMSGLVNGRLCILRFRVVGVVPAEGCDIRLKGRGPTPLVDLDFKGIEHQLDSSKTLGLLQQS